MRLCGSTAWPRRCYFNPRTPCGVRHSEHFIHAASYLFQSTHPLRGATCCASAPPRQPTHFNPRTPCGVRPGYLLQPAFAHDFNPRTPCGVRRGCYHVPNWGQYFNPRTPCGVRLARGLSKVSWLLFQSTHPLRGATIRNRKSNQQMKFQSTHPLRGATTVPDGMDWVATISIHAPLAGCDVQTGL